jgi:hypothetical protein
MPRYSDTLVRIAGGDLDTVDTIKRARLMHHLIACAMVITSTMAVASMTFFAHDALKTSWALASTVALGWGVLIFMLERIVTTLGMSSAGIGSVVTTSVRVLMALVIGAIISAPLTMRIFKSDIDFYLAQMAASNATMIKNQIANSPEQAQVLAVKQQITSWQQEAQGVLPNQQDSSQVSALKSRLFAAQATLARSQHDLDQNSAWYNCEAYGTDRAKLDNPGKCAPGSGGPNGNTQAAKTARDASLKQVAVDQNNVDAIAANLQAALATQQAAIQGQVQRAQAQAPAQLDALNRQLDAANHQLQDLTDRLNGTNNGNSGFLAQLQALDTASSKAPILNFWKWLIFWAFVLIDVLPATSKLAYLYSPDGRRYHDLLTMSDESAVSGLQAQLAADESVEQARITADRDMRIRLDNEAIRQAEIELRDALQKEIDAWKAGLQTGSTGAVNVTGMGSATVVRP